jgi:hypothetical protein
MRVRMQCVHAPTCTHLPVRACMHVRVCVACPPTCSPLCVRAFLRPVPCLSVPVRACSSMNTCARVSAREVRQALRELVLRARRVCTLVRACTRCRAPARTDVVQQLPRPPELKVGQHVQPAAACASAAAAPPAAQRLAARLEAGARRGGDGGWGGGGREEDGWGLCVRACVRACAGRACWACTTPRTSRIQNAHSPCEKVTLLEVSSHLVPAGGYRNADSSRPMPESGCAHARGPGRGDGGVGW